MGPGGGHERKKSRMFISPDFSDGRASWCVDEMYVKVQGEWQHLYRALDRDGNLIDAQLSDTRDLAAAEAFFRSAWTVTGMAPYRITTDGHEAYPRAIRHVFREGVTHRT